MGCAAEQAVKDRLGGQNVRIHGEELFEHWLAVFRAPLADAVREESDADVVTDRLDGGLINAN